MNTLAKIFLFVVLSVSFFVALGVLAFSISHPEQAIEFLQGLKPSPTTTPVQITGVGIIGDSLSDEYRADDNRGLTYAPTTLNWVEILQQKRNFPVGEWGVYEEPRREGYAYNFARTGSSISMAIENNQHSELADEIKNGHVNTVIMYIGVNDFSPLATDGYEQIYYGTLTDVSITRKVNRIAADVKTIIQTLQNAGEVHIMLVTIPDWGNHSLVQLAFPIPEQRNRVTSVIEQANEELSLVAQQTGVKIANSGDFYNLIEKKKVGNRLLLGGATVDIHLPGDDPRRLFLDDGVHPGTIYNGLFANFIIENLNSSFGTSIKALSDEEILSVAGL